MNPHRILRQPAAARRGAVLYWMSREQRVRDNWALLYAQECALTSQAPLLVCFCLAPRYADASREQYKFMIRGLREVHERCRALAIPFLLRTDAPEDALPAIVDRYRIETIVTDVNPLRVRRTQIRSAASSVRVPLIEIDAHNIVPVWHASPKQEYGAYTLRPKLHRLLPDFMDEFPEVVRHPFPPESPIEEPDWTAAFASITAVGTSQPVFAYEPGEDAARRLLDGFLTHRLHSYATGRNDPTLDAQSHLSPYIHFGQIAAQRVALEVQRCSGITASDRRARADENGGAPPDAQDPLAASALDFLEELIVRRELAENFCYYNERYDSFDGVPAWAARTLNLHRNDPRPYTYGMDAFASAATHDPLWNAAQRQMLATGCMHGYMRMYWAKKILEWTASPEEAMAIAIHLNDRYELDGRDPNGYAGIAWSIGGVHDRAWFERPVFGKIRYMNAAGCARKFDVKKYITMFTNPEGIEDRRGEAALRPTTK